MEILPGVLELPLWSILAVVIAALLYMYSTRKYKIWSAQGIKGPTPRPFLGTFHLELKAGCFGNCDLDFVKQYGKIFGGFRSSTPMLCVADPEFLRQAYIKEFAAMPNRTHVKMNAISDTMLISLTDDRWKHVRGAISPTFTTGKLKQMVRRIQDCSVKLVEHISQFEGEPFDAKDSVGSYTMDVISSTAFGIQMDSRANPNHPMIWHAKEMMGLNKKGGLADFLAALKIFILFVISPRWMPKYLTRLGFDIFDQKSTEYFKNIVDQVITSRDKLANKDADFVQLCLDKVVPDPMMSDSGSQKDKYGALWTPKGLARDELVGNAILFFVAGYETTASTLHYAMFELAWNQDVQEKAVEEINKIMGDRPVTEQPTYDELNQMEYLEWVLNETMRFYPAAPRVERLTERECTIEGVTIPKGSIVDACVYAIHHDPEHWPDPFKFDPERYSPENKKTRHQYAWIPFGMGMRNCIGMRLAMLEMKIGLIAILRSCKLETCEQTLKRSSDRPIKFAKTMRIDPEETIIIKASRRLA